MDSPIDLARLKALDDAEWRRVEEMYAPRLLAYVARRVKDREAREDIVQDCLLVAVRNIERVDPAQGFEAYLFNILGSRVIDWLRRKRPVQLTGLGLEESAAHFDFVAAPRETPSQVARQAELEDGARILLGAAAREWCREGFEAGAFERVAVFEAVVVRGVRNKDAARRFGHPDDGAVAGVKFRGLKRIAELVQELDASGAVKEAVLSHLSHEDRPVDLDFARAWSEARAACPAREWLENCARGAGGAEQVHVRHHAPDCAACSAELDHLRADPHGLEAASLLERLQGRRAAGRDQEG
ncbi:MAG: polymerase sigma-E factor [Planctomycetota bacterium]